MKQSPSWGQDDLVLCCTDFHFLFLASLCLCKFPAISSISSGNKFDFTFGEQLVPTCWVITVLMRRNWKILCGFVDISIIKRFYVSFEINMII